MMKTQDLSHRCSGENELGYGFDLFVMYKIQWMVECLIQL